MPPYGPHLFDHVSSLLEIKETIPELIEKYEIPLSNFTLDQWQNVEIFQNFLRPFANFIYELEENKFTSLSYVPPRLFEIKFVLSQTTQDQDGLACFNLSQRLLHAMNEKFTHIFSTGYEHFDVSYSLATFLDPQFSRTLDWPELHELKQAAIKQASRELSKDFVSRASANALSTVVSENEIYTYLQIVVNHKNENAIDFWIKQQNQLPQLYRLAMTVLAVPASATSPFKAIEKHYHDLQRDFKDCDSEEVLERQAMSRVNRSVLGL